MALEFAFFDSSLMYFEKLHESWLKEKRRKNQAVDSADESSFQRVVEEYMNESKLEKKDHNIVVILLCSFLSGFMAGMITNPFEYIGVNKQEDKNFKVMNKLRQKGGIREMLISGSLMRSLYNGFSAMIFFTLL